jgi:hypothetical protein
MGFMPGLDAVMKRKIPPLSLPGIESHSSTSKGYAGCIYKWYSCELFVYMHCIMHIELQRVGTHSD